MRVALLAASAFGARCLELLVGLPEIQVVGVVTAPRTFRISYSSDGVTNVLHADLAAAARSHLIPCTELTSSMNDPALLKAVNTWRPDAFLVAGWYHMVPRSWRTIAPAYGLHASLLPDYSGGAPLVWAMINGESQTGITLFEMDDGVDSGPIVDQRIVQIEASDDIASLYARVEEAGLDLVQSYASTLGTSDLPTRLQDESQRRIMPQRSPEDGRINWNQTSSALDRFVRAQTRPYPGAFGLLNNERVTVWRASIETALDPPKHGTAGSLIIKNGWVSVSCGDGALRLLEVGFRDQIAQGTEIVDLMLAHQMTAEEITL